MNAMRIPAVVRGGHWLLTSAGAKADLARRMRGALHEFGLKLFACDVSPLSAAFCFSDGSFLLPPAVDPTYPEALATACEERGISVILPTRDADLRLLTQIRAQLEKRGVWVLASPHASVEVCLDKIRFHAHCVEQGLPVLPRIETPTDSDFPLFARLRRGAASKNAGRMADADGLRALYGTPPWPDLLLQSSCDDPEFTVDALFGPDGRPVQWMARERIRVRAGESVVGRTVAIPGIDDSIPGIAERLPLFGPVTLQAFYAKETGVRWIEINPRIGGGAALGIEAGLDTPRRLVALAQGDIETFLKPRPLHYGLTMLRYARDFFIPGDGQVGVQ